jgi:hypothetical protein
MSTFALAALTLLLISAAVIPLALIQVRRNPEREVPRARSRRGMAIGTLMEVAGILLGVLGILLAVVLGSSTAVVGGVGAALGVVLLFVGSQLRGDARGRALDVALIVVGFSSAIAIALRAPERWTFSVLWGSAMLARPAVASWRRWARNRANGQEAPHRGA